MKSLKQTINEKLILKKGYNTIDGTTIYTDKYHPEKIMDAIDNLFGRRHHKISIDYHNYNKDAKECYTTTFTYETNEDIIKLCTFFELLFGVSYYKGDIDDTEDMAYFIRDGKLIHNIGEKHQNDLDKGIQDYEDHFYEIYNDCLK